MKKGMSSVVSVVLIVLLGLGSVGIVWNFVLPIFRGYSGAFTEVKSMAIDFDIIAQSVVIDSDNNVSFFD